MTRRISPVDRKPPRRKLQATDLLRAEAEARVALRAPVAPLPRTHEELLHDLHDLHVHQIELEMQNEQLRLAQAELEKSRDQYADLYEFAPVGYLTLTSNSQIVEINHTGAGLLGQGREELLIRRFDKFVAPADVERWQRAFVRLKSVDGRLIDQFELQPQGKAVFLAEVTGQRELLAGYDQTLIVRLVLVDLSASQAATEKRHLEAIHRTRLAGNDAEAVRQALTDPLTHLPNRRLMLDRLHHAMAATFRTKKYCALLFIDLDEFKAINDTLGHDIGDQFLQQVAQRLCACVREGDTVARYGGDEFIVILENLSDRPEEAVIQARDIGDKIAAALHQPCKLSGCEYAGSGSIGVTVFSSPRESAEELLKRADLAMYEAKSAGRSALRFFDPTMQATVTARNLLEAELRRALASDQLKCHFQLQINAAGQVRGAEVLLRWQHPQRGLMSPSAFLQVAEESGLLATIGQWVLETACAQLKTWSSVLPDRHMQLAVNIGARQFHQTDFVAQLRTLLDYTGIDPSSLMLEFKEKTALADLDESIAKMAALKTLGVRLAIDDFGVGSSSLAQLTQLPLDQLKIDQSIVHDIGVKPCDKAIVKTLIDVTKHLGLEVMAEGVETAAQHEFLAQHGCHAFQGYLFGGPVSPAEFEQIICTH